jgi:hypothetical protein
MLPMILKIRPFAFHFWWCHPVLCGAPGRQIVEFLQHAGFLPMLQLA